MSNNKIKKYVNKLNNLSFKRNSNPAATLMYIPEFYKSYILVTLTGKVIPANVALCLNKQDLTVYDTKFSLLCM